MRCQISNLPNGLAVVTSPMKERKSAAIGLWIKAGGRYETEKLNGVSHYLEHVVFKGTARRSANEIKESVEGIGGSLNAFTGEEYTCFLAKSASRHFELVFDVLADMVQRASLKPEAVEKERTVILEEIKMTQDQPSQLVEEVLEKMIWRDHPLGSPITGSRESVQALTRGDIQCYRDSFYQAPHMVVSVAGNVTHKKVLALAKQIKGASRRGRSHRASAFTRSQTAHAVRALEKKTEQTHLAIGFHALAKNDPDEYTLDLINVMLGGNMSSRLFNEVREKRGLAYEIGSFVRRFEDTGSFQISAGVDNNKTKDAFGVILNELRKLKKNPVLNSELHRAKEFYLGQMMLGLESSTNQMIWVGENMLSLGRIRTPETVSRGVLSVTAGDVRRLAKRLFTPQSFNGALVGPGVDSLQGSLDRAVCALC